MSTAFLVVWAIATVALAVRFMRSDRRDEARRRERHRASGDVRPFPERSRVVFVAEAIVFPVALALVLSAVVGGLLGVAYKILTV